MQSGAQAGRYSQVKQVRKGRRPGARVDAFAAAVAHLHDEAGRHQGLASSEHSAEQEVEDD